MDESSEIDEKNGETTNIVIEVASGFGSEDNRWGVTQIGVTRVVLPFIDYRLLRAHGKDLLQIW